MGWGESLLGAGTLFGLRPLLPLAANLASVLPPAAEEVHPHLCERRDIVGCLPLTTARPPSTLFS